MPIVSTRIKSSTYFLTDIQEDEMKLLVKTGETANHTRIKKDHFKYKSRYHNASQEDAIDFINNAFTTIGSYLAEDSDNLDHTTTLDLCQIISDSDNEKEKNALMRKKGDTDDDEEEDILKIKLPPIPKKLKAYKAHVVRDSKSVGWKAKGIKYSKQKIDELDKVADEYLKAAEEVLKSKKLDPETEIEIKEGVLKAQRRKEDYADFRKKNYTYYPIKINVLAAFDDGSSNPYEYYETPDFDFNNKKQFKYKVSGNLNLTTHNKNKIVLEASGEEFEFSVNGFGIESEEKILINHQYKGI